VALAWRVCQCVDQDEAVDDFLDHKSAKVAIEGDAEVEQL